MPGFLRSAFATFCLSALLLPTPRPAGAADPAGVGGLLVAPTRVSLEARDRSAELTLMNRGTSPETYRLELVDMVMDATGQMRQVAPEEVVQHSAVALVRFSPRQVSLGPSETQKVRLMVRKPAGLPDGEYRSHLLVRPLPAVDKVEARGEEAAAGGQLSIRLTTLAALSIPVIVRHGRLDLDLDLVDLAVVPADAGGQRSVRLTVERRGQRSAYGDLQVQFLPADGGSVRDLGMLRGVAVYAQNAARHVHVDLDAAPAGKGRLRVRYLDPAAQGQGVLAEAHLQLN